MVLKVILGALMVLFLAALVFTAVSALLWWLVPLAFPAVEFGFYNAVALTGILLLIGLPALKN